MQYAHARPRLLVAPLAAFCLSAVCLPPAFAADEHPYISGGYQEAVFSVSDLAQQTAFYEAVAGWQVLHRGAVSPTLLRAYGLPTNVRGTEVVLGNPGTERGFLRLLKFHGADQQQIRSNAQSWDTGGFFDVNSRVDDMAGKFAEFQARDWQAASDPVQFSFGPFVVKEWLTRGPDGIVLALIERVQPPLEGWPNLRELSRLFNATQIVADAEEARRFYVDKLGFDVYLEHTAASEQPESNVLGLPHNVAVDVPRIVYILHPQGTNEGSIEILAFDGADGSDFSERARPPNLGILTLRFPLSDIEGFAKHVAAEGIEVAVAPTRTELKPYGEVWLMAIRGPGGVWLEFFQTV
jgi:catechol 2,3-dioxygenase-like lactoylglutathione lyase family enzyme